MEGYFRLFIYLTYNSFSKYLQMKVRTLAKLMDFVSQNMCGNEETLNYSRNNKISSYIHN